MFLLVFWMKIWIHFENMAQLSIQHPPFKSSLLKVMPFCHFRFFSGVRKECSIMQSKSNLPQPGFEPATPWFRNSARYHCAIDACRVLAYSLLVYNLWHWFFGCAMIDWSLWTHFEYANVC